MENNKSILLKIKRQDNPSAKPYWQQFEILYKPGANIISCLQEIQKKPITQSGETVAPIIWESSCLEEVCGSCTMVVNGKVRQACTALIDKLKHPIVLEPMSKFPIVRDLAVDRTRMFENLKKVHGWIHVDGTYEIGEGPTFPEKQRAKAYVLSECMTCGCCLEACPQFTIKNDFMGASTFSQVRLFNMHPTGAMEAEERLEAVMGKGGITDCGNAQVCVEVCPKNIPLTESIAEVGKQTTWQMIKNFIMR